MKLHLEMEYEVSHYEHGNGLVTLESVRFPGCTQNLMPFMTTVDLIKAQAELECAVESAAIDKVITLCERKDVEADYRREIALEFQREELASRAAQRGFR